VPTSITPCSGVAITRTCGSIYRRFGCLSRRGPGVSGPLECCGRGTSRDIEIRRFLDRAVVDLAKRFLRLECHHSGGGYARPMHVQLFEIRLGDQGLQARVGNVRPVQEHEIEGGQRLEAGEPAIVDRGERQGTGRRSTPEESKTTPSRRQGWLSDSGLGGCANRFWQADSRMPNKDRHPVHDAGYFSRNLRLARAENQSDLTPSREAAKKTQRNPNDLFHSSNLIAGYPRFELFSSLRLCGSA
jgi:hypothetical protein